jgi:hypothetical protein
MTRRPLRLAIVAGIVVLIAACGGSTASPAASTGAGASPSASAAEPSAASSPSEVASPSQAAVPGASPDLSQILGSVTKLDSLTSYQITITMQAAAGTTDIAVTSIRKPVEASRYDISTPQGQKIVVVRIGSDAWVSQDGTTFVKTPATAVTTMLDLFTPEALLGGFQKQDAFKALTAVGTETRNGVQTTHYHIDDTTPLPSDAKGTIPPGASADIWVSEEGYLVGLEAKGLASGMTSMSLEVTHINDSGLKVEPPK